VGFHRSGCRVWFVAERDTRTNEVQWTALPADAPGSNDPQTPDASKASGEAEAKPATRLRSAEGRIT
jgi:sarcosine oxidase delta subunit